MKNLVDFALKEKYNQVKKLRSRLEDMKSLIDWEAFLPLFPEKETNLGRPAYDKILMLKILIIQSWYGISDEELEFQIYDRLSFQQFLDFPKNIPDYSTIWRFREELSEGDTLDKIWAELKRQIKEKNLRIKEGVIQDATFITADPGRQKSSSALRGRDANTSRSKDGTWTKKGKKSFFGFKKHVKIQKGSKIIEEVAITTARVHDGAIDLANPDEIVYKDRGYTGIKTKAKGNGTMKRGNLTPKQKLRNKRITKRRAEGEHPFATIRKSFKGGHTRLTTICRVFVQQVFVCVSYNIYRIRYLTTT
ncbi:MAG: IS5 family transposase [Nanoarchaeota archaeon]|nr:IS5 family transposase [Nanoarchaeota archaeon]